MIRMSRPLIGKEEMSAVLAVLQSGMLAQGPQVQQFEQDYAEYCGVEYAVATSSGSTALHLALLAHGIGPNDEVITSPFGFVASANAILHVGAHPVFADIESDTFNLDPEQTERRITPRTRAIMPVHLFGHPAEMTKLMGLAQRHNLALVEDACQAHGAEFQGRKVGSFGTGCFSFYPTKNITSAEGGMVITGDPNVAERMRLLRDHGMRRRYHHETLGYNFRMSDVHAAIGLAQLSKLERFNQARGANADILTAQLQDAVTCPVIRRGVRHVFQQYTVRVHERRDTIQEKLRAAGVESAIYYPIPIHKQRQYRELGYGQESYPVTEAACDQVLSLPVHPGIDQDDLNTVASAVRESLVVGP